MGMAVYPPMGLAGERFFDHTHVSTKNRLGGLEMKKKTAAFLSITVLAVAMLAGCGQKGSGETSAAPEEIGASEGNDTDTTAAVDDDE